LEQSRDARRGHLQLAQWLTAAGAAAAAAAAAAAVAAIAAAATATATAATAADTAATAATATTAAGSERVINARKMHSQPSGGGGRDSRAATSGRAGSRVR
jgi:hypothetical protein